MSLEVSGRRGAFALAQGTVIDSDWNTILTEAQAMATESAVKSSTTPTTGAGGGAGGGAGDATGTGGTGGTGGDETTRMLLLNAAIGKVTVKTNIATSNVKEGNEDDKETARLK